MRGKYKNSIYYVIIGIIICAGIGFIINYSIFMNKNYITQYNGFMLESVSDTHNLLSRNLSYMNNTVMTIKMSDEVKAWAKATEWSDMHLQAINVQKKIKQETIYNNDLKFKIAITFLDDRELVVTANLTSQKYLFFEQMGLKREEINRIYEEMKSSISKSVMSKSTNSEGEDYIHYFTKFNYNQVELLYITSISEKAILEFLKDTRGDYYIFNSEEILFQEDDVKYEVQDIHEEVLGNYNQIKEVSSAEEDKIYKYQGKRIIVKPIEEVEWVLAYIYELEFVEFEGLLVGICCIMVAAIILALLIGKLTTNKLYRPVKQLLDDIVNQDAIKGQEKIENQDKIGDKAIDNEFEYISSYNKRIQEDNSALYKVIADNKAIIKEKFYKDLIHGIKAYKKEAYREFSEADKLYRVALIEFETVGERLEDEFTFEIKGSIKKKTAILENMEYINIDYKSCALIIIGELEIKEIRKSILQIIKEVEVVDTLKVKIALGHLVEDMDSLGESFLKAKQIIEYRNAFPNRMILTEQDVQQLDFTTSTFPIKVENKLITGVLHGDKEVLELLDRLIKDNLEGMHQSVYHKKNFVLAMVVTINRIFDQMSVTPQSYLKEGYGDYLSLYEEYNEEVADKLRKIFGIIATEVKVQEVQSKKDMSDQMLEYIYTHYPEDIMLEDMAATLNISVKYCSVLFKRVTGENFKTVLNRYRIERAKELLEGETIKVSEVATLVGFNSPNTFIRVFNQYVGMSPGAYQEQSAKRA